MSLHLTREYLSQSAVATRVNVGDFTYGQPQVFWWGEDTYLTIGKYCSIAVGVSIFLGGNHRSDWVTVFPFTAWSDAWPQAAGIEGHPASKGNVTIGNDVWLGNQCTVLSGVTIGDGAVVGSHCVVSKDIPPYSIVVGNPCRIIRKRFSEQQIEALLNIQWWNFPVEKLNSLLPLMLNSDIDAFIEKCGLPVT
ncbi:CatB-related O-acetyltransferase [Anaerospora hongkongensis]|uniref:CatB-related O-acetyltransferase n=1 Tax=Anaerospora hongkongensis TaxID=244830 RepID=UPI00289C5826|nr:CatB-related O-acetyltransferase [Anaerospora hongkongensis]